MFTHDLVFVYRALKEMPVSAARNGKACMIKLTRIEVSDRMDEYSMFNSRKGGGGSDSYLSI